MMWRSHIGAFFQDEDKWFEGSKNYNLFEYSKINDSGYFTPILRIVGWIFFRVFGSNPTALHLFSALIASACCASIIILYPNNSQLYPKTISAFILGVFPSFDLLLYFNLSYFILIPTLLLSLRVKQKIGKKQIMLLSLLILILAKPQLLVCILLVLTFKQYKSKFKTYFNSIPILLAILLLFISRANSDSISLELAPKNLFFGLSALLQMPATLLFPIISIALEGYFRLNDLFFFLTIVQVFKVFGSCIIAYFLITKMNKSNISMNITNTAPFVLSIIPIYTSLFIFSNSGWSFDYFWNLNSTISLYSRHFFALVVVSTIIQYKILENFKVQKVVSILLLCQYLILSITAYDYLYFPI